MESRLQFASLSIFFSLPNVPNHCQITLLIHDRSRNLVSLCEAVMMFDVIVIAVIKHVENLDWALRHARRLLRLNILP